MPKCPPHHWMIDSYNIGYCIKEGCNAVMDFNRLQGHESKLLGLKSLLNETEARAKRSAAAKKRWQDPEYRTRQSAAMRAAWQDPEYRARQKVTHVSLPGRHHKKEGT
ncbi:unnamed protein product [marine sediment metagenome]|uniref:Uncharacterized protein n=1 Tax=marine sediment metagenome TaxID=412755 RepID=X1M6L2_9ZZZZ